MKEDLRRNLATRGVKHWVLGNCLQKGRAQGYDLGCAENIGSINCKDCLRELNDCRVEWLKLRQQQVVTDNSRAHIQDAEIAAARRQIYEYEKVLKASNISVPEVKHTLHYRGSPCPKCGGGMLLDKKSANSKYMTCNQPNCRYVAVVELIKF